MYVYIYIHIHDFPASLARSAEGKSRYPRRMWILLGIMPSWVMLSNLQKENLRLQQITAAAMNQQQKWDVDRPQCATFKTVLQVQKNEGQVVPKCL